MGTVKWNQFFIGQKVKKKKKTFIASNKREPASGELAFEEDASLFSCLESNPGLPRCRRILYYLNHEGSPN